MSTHDIVISEDVWGEPFDELSQRHVVLADPDLWADRARLLGHLTGAKALVVRNRTIVDAELLAAAPDLKIVARAGVGLENIDLRAAARHDVVVISPRGANSRSVAEYTVGAALALLRHLTAHDRAVRTGTWNRAAGRELAGRTWGILGAGSTGLAVAEMVRALGLDVLGFDPYVDSSHPDIAAAGVTLTSLDDLCRRSDVVSIHLPGTVATNGLVDDRLLGIMRSDSVLINAGRGGIVDEDALADALESGTIAGAALDVRVYEPPALGRLEELDTVLLTPHIAGITVESQGRINQALADDISAVLSGGIARFAVNGTGLTSAAPISVHPGVTP